ncbi:MAG: hypothetical protein ACKVXR_02500 [Planctomycetota bacterium]
MTLAGHGSRRWTGLAFLAVLAALFLLRPTLAGWPLLSSAGVAGVFAAYVLFPGWCVARLLRPDDEPWLAVLMLAWTVGLALLAGAFVAACVLDVRDLIRWYPLPFVLLAAVRWRGKPGSALVLPTGADLLACGLLLAAAALRSTCEGPEEWYLHGGDSAFHAGNAAELRWRWPMQDPRLAGEPLRYHYFSYVFACVQSLVLDAPVRTGLLGMGGALHPMGFALAAFAAARGLGARTWIAAACAAALVLHTDLGAALATNSLFDKGLYVGSSTPLGLTFLVALLFVLGGSLRAGGLAGVRDLALFGLLAFGASGSKGSVLPPLFLGLATVLVLRSGFRREFPGRVLLHLAVLAACALPMMLYLLGSPSSNASSMFTFEPLAAQRMSAFHETTSSWFGAGAALALAPVWTALFLGSGTIGLLAWVLLGERPRPLYELVLLASAAAGLLPAWLLVAPGHSQLFFTYDTQVCLMLLGAVGLERAWRSSGPARWVLIASFAAVLALQARRVAHWQVPRLLEQQPEGSESSRAYQAALSWVRENLERDAVLLVGPTWSNPSTWTERRIFFESAAFNYLTHAGWRVPWRATGAEPALPPFADRQDLEQRFLANPDPATLAAIRARIPAGTPLYALRDDVHLVKIDRRNTAEFRRVADEPWGRSVGAELVHATPWLEVYRLP